MFIFQGYWGHWKGEHFSVMSGQFPELKIPIEMSGLTLDIGTITAKFGYLTLTGRDVRPKIQILQNLSFLMALQKTQFIIQNAKKKKKKWR